MPAEWFAHRNNSIIHSILFSTTFWSFAFVYHTLRNPFVPWAGWPGVSTMWLGGSSPLMLEVLGLIPAWHEKISGCEHAPLTALVGMMLIECTVLQIGMLTLGGRGEGRLCRERHHLCMLKIQLLRKKLLLSGPSCKTKPHWVMVKCLKKEVLPDVVHMLWFLIRIISMWLAWYYYLTFSSRNMD